MTAPTGAGLTYSIDGINYQAATTFTAVAPGPYNVTVQDAGGCISTPTALTVNAAPAAPAAPTASVTVQPTCAVPTGTIVVTAPLGAGFTYSIDGINYQAATTFTAVGPGPYNVTVQDAGGCISGPTALTVNGAPGAPAAPTASATVQPTCAAPTGTIVVTAPLGAGLTYSIDGINYQAATTFTAVAPGPYNVTVQDAGGCTSAGTAVTLNAATVPVAPTASVTVQPTCATPTGTIVITAPTGAGLTYSIDGINYQAATTFTAVAPGPYNVTVQDAGGCISTPTALTVNAAPAAPAAPTASVTVQPTCAVPTGTIVVTAPTGAGLTYSIDGINYQAATTFTAVGPGPYNVTVQDAGGCISGPTALTVNGAPGAPAAPTASATVQPTCAAPTGNHHCDRTARSRIIYSIDGINYQAATTFTAVAPGPYNVTVQDAGGCTSAGTACDIKCSNSTCCTNSIRNCSANLCYTNRNDRSDCANRRRSYL